MPALAQVATQRQAMIDIDGHRMSALIYNMDRYNVPVVFVHGITSSVYFWNAGQTPYVMDNLRWYSLSLPGHYPAAFPADFTAADLTAETIADLTAESIKKLVGPNEPVILGGHSTGGFVALATAIYHPRLVKGVFSISGFAHGRWTGVLRPYQLLAQMGILGEWLFKQGFSFAGHSQDMYYRLLRFYAADVDALYASSVLNSVIDDTYPASADLDLDAMLLWFRQMPETDITHRLPEINVPTLIMTGENDPVVPPTQATKIHKHIPHSELVTYPGAGHLPFAERESDYHIDVTNWLRNVLGD